MLRLATKIATSATLSWPTSIQRIQLTGSHRHGFTQELNVPHSGDLEIVKILPNQEVED